MPFRNDQLVGCLTDMQNLEGDLEDLINDQNQHEYNQYNVDPGVHTGQLVNQPAGSMAGQLGSGQFENAAYNQSTNAGGQQMGYLLDSSAGERRANFDFNTTTDFSKPQQLGGYPTAGNLDPFDAIDDELELQHLKELEDLMETNQSTQLDDLAGPVVGHPLNGPINQCNASQLSGGNRAGANLPLSVGISELPSNLQSAQAQQSFLLLANQQQSTRANSHPPSSFENNHSSSFSTTVGAQIAGARRIIQSPSSIQVI